MYRYLFIKTQVKIGYYMNTSTSYKQSLARIQFNVGQFWSNWWKAICHGNAPLKKCVCPIPIKIYTWWKVDSKEDQKVEDPLFGTWQPWKMSRQKKANDHLCNKFLSIFNPSNIYLVRVNVSSNMFKHPFKLKNLMV